VWAVYGHVEALEWTQAHWPSARRVAFAFPVVLAVYQINKRTVRNGQDGSVSPCRAAKGPPAEPPQVPPPGASRPSIPASLSWRLVAQLR
jgi:hypothetical protein